jgi:hypothetical protein
MNNQFFKYIKFNVSKHFNYITDAALNCCVERSHRVIRQIRQSSLKGGPGNKGNVWLLLSQRRNISHCALAYAIIALNWGHSAGSSTKIASLSVFHWPSCDGSLNIGGCNPPASSVRQTSRDSPLGCTAPYKNPEPVASFQVDLFQHRVNGCRYGEAWNATLALSHRYICLTHFPAMSF